MSRKLTVVALLLLVCPLVAFAEEDSVTVPFDDSQMPRAFSVGSAAGGAGAEIAFSVIDGDDGPRVNGARCSRIIDRLCACVASGAGHCYLEACNELCSGF